MMDSEKAPMADEKTSVPSVSPSIGQTSLIEEPTARQQRTLTNKIDLKVIPILGLLYLICFLDRTNIANAKIAGLVDGLDMPSTGYNTALWLFYLPFVLAEVPSNMIMSLPSVKPNLWLGGQCFILGKPILLVFIGSKKLESEIENES
jgi:hypothetical protein